MAGQKSRKRRRQILWIKQEGRCYFCKIHMIHWNDRDNDPGKTYHNQKARDRFATIDHLRDRFHPDRQEKNTGHEQRWVLSCWRCNFERGRESLMAVPIEVRRASAGRFPRDQQPVD